MAEHQNRLRFETSPYLLQHAKNPVDWYPWGAEALERARSEDKPIFLSIGYAACHWCHVMERESFENARIAEFLNQHFVAIKVDREERPDIDEIYMSATVALSGGGGWPMSVFLAPDQRPFFAGTYYPPVDRYGRPGFITLLTRIAELWQSDRAALFQQAEQLTEHVREASRVTAPGAVRADAVASAVADYARSFDAQLGGFGSAPKFPPHQGLRLLLRAYDQLDDESALKMARTTLDGMKNGGIYDQLGGGFCRYSTDERWLVPHFEKMLYDNAQLAVAYLEAFQITRDAEYQRVAKETLDYVAREMQSPAGGYYSATDADSEGEEGKFFVFLPEEIDDILGKDRAEAFCLYYDISVPGNWEGKNVLNTPRPLADIARELGREPNELAKELADSRRALYEARARRVPPSLDDKVLTAWNGLMIDAMATGYDVLGDPRYLDSATRAASFVLEHLSRPDGGLLRTTRGGKAHIDAFLEDYAYLSDALLSLYEASGEPRWLAESLRLAERMLTDFGDDQGPLYQTSKHHESLIARVSEGHDGALPNANAVAARVLARLAFHLDRPDLSTRAEHILTAFGALIERSPRAFATALMAAQLLLAGPTELVLVGRPGAEDTRALSRAISEQFIAHRILVRSDPSHPADTPLARDKPLVGDRAALYVCRNFTCDAPITDASAVASALTHDREGRSGRAALSASGVKSAM